MRDDTKNGYVADSASPVPLSSKLLLSCPFQGLVLKPATSVIFNLSSDRSFFYQVGGEGWWDLRRGVPKIWLKGGPGKKILGVKGASPK